MKKITAAIVLLTILLSGCTAKETGPDASLQPGPTASIDTGETLQSFRSKGVEAIIEIIPAGLRPDIPFGEIPAVGASLNISSCEVTIDWETEVTMEEAAGILSQKLGFNLVKGENDWRNPDNMTDPGIRIKENESGLTLLYILPISHAQGTILTDGFPLDHFSDLPDGFALPAADRAVTYSDDQTTWQYQLTWHDQDEEAADRLKGYCASKEGYEERIRQENTTVSYDISGNEKMSSWWVPGSSFPITFAYIYRTPGHPESTLMQSLLSSPISVLMADLQEGCLGILPDTDGASLSYNASDRVMCYSIQGPANEDREAIAERAACLTGEPLALNSRGGYDHAGEDFTLTIKFNEGFAGWEYEKKTDEGFRHPYIHDIYPSSYQPVLPGIMKSEPELMATSCTMENNSIRIVFKKTWKTGNEEEANSLFNALGEALKGCHGYNTGIMNGRKTINCIIKEYGYECELFQKDGSWFISAAFKYQKEY